MRILLIAIATGLLVTAFGGVSSCGFSIAIPPTQPPTQRVGSDVVVTEKDTATPLNVGEKLNVVLHAGNQMNNWMRVRSSNESFLDPTVNPAATAVRGVTLAAFNARAPGEAEITAYSSPTCPPGQACPMYVQVWSVRVTVTG